VSALEEVEGYLRNHPDLDAYLVDVRAQRALSQQIAARSGIRHESPQVIIFRRGLPIWNASHDEITAGELARRLPGS
jgi:bacillithiol system protein YtxJ